jgi:hypothetical protein
MCRAAMRPLIFTALIIALMAPQALAKTRVALSSFIAASLLSETELEPATGGSAAVGL